MMRWAGHLTRMEGMRNDTEFWSEYVMGTDHAEDLDVDGRIILKWILEK
jgi:hypothetical protein